MDAFELLKQDHKKVSKLFSKIESASGQAKSELFDQLKSELDLHAHVEETVLYPALEDTEEAREITLEAYEEHKVVKDLLGELASAADQNEEWDAKLKVLKENVEHHVEEEEGELFGKARKALGQERIETLGVELEAEKASKSGAPKPRRATESKPTAARNKTARNEKPGVLQRLANLVGLGESPSDEPANTTSSPAKSPAKKSSKRQAAKSKSTSARKKAPASKAASKSATNKGKSRPAKSATLATKAAARKTRGEARSSKRATTTSKKSASRGSRTSATKTASRAASNQRVKAGGASGAKKAGARNKSR